MNSLYSSFVDPPNEFSQLPWWFWNDEITEEGIRKQLADFREQHVHGFTIHARMGLSTSIPYLGARWFELVRFAVEEAAQHNMVVHLYDEGMYPSGSAHGEVVAGHPEFAARGLEMRRVEPGQKHGLGEQEKLVAVRRDGEAAAMPPTDGASLTETPGWLFVLTPSGGKIRGVHEGEEDRDPNAPAASDLLNPAAVRRFIECTHERYYQELRRHFGTTIQAIFTDEPSIMGRGAKRGLQPWTDGLADEFQQKKGYDLIPHLAGLWEDIGPRTKQVRQDYHDVIAERFNDSFYQQISDWCAAHGIALTGHPAASDDIGPQRYFQLPGQDMVWRYVEPAKPSALEGAHSTAAKCSSSAARHLSARRNGDELYGAYGWRLTLDEMKWLADWMMVRGVNLFWPHAFYYSVRDFRAYERPPDVGPNNLWWKHYHTLADYTRRLCWLLTDSEQVCDIAILARHNHLPWEPAKVLLQNQFDFNYLEDTLLQQATIEDGKIQIGEAIYSVVIQMAGHSLSGSAGEALARFAASGGHIIPFEANENGDELLPHLRGILPTDVSLAPANPDLRTIHVKKGGYEFYYLSNEGEEDIEGHLTVHAVGATEWWNPLTGEKIPSVILASDSATTTVALELDRREGMVLVVDPERAAQPAQPDWKPTRFTQARDISDGWTISDLATGHVVSQQLADWTSLDGYGHFSGSLVYTQQVHVQPEEADEGMWFLDLGEVYDFVEVHCNGEPCGVRLWAPHCISVPLRSGSNTLEMRVTNSMANRMDKAGLPSGMLGPVSLGHRG